MLTRKLFLGMLVPLYYQAVEGTTVTAAQGHLRNVTIDDHFGDEITHDAPIYQPPNKWKTSGGHANPAVSLAYDGTWHDATRYPRDGEISMSFGFTGVSLYVYCIIANTPPAGSKVFEAFANYSFFLDGEFVDTYTHDVEQRTDFLYNVPVYINRTMTNEPHNFIIRMENNKQTLLLFDYAVYTRIETTSTPMQTSMGAPTSGLPSAPAGAHSTEAVSSLKAGIIAAATLGGLSILIFFGTFIFCRLQKADRAGPYDASQWRRSRFVVHSESKVGTPSPSPSSKEAMVRMSMRLSSIYGSGEDGAGQLKGFGAGIDAVEYA